MNYDEAMAWVRKQIAENHITIKPITSTPHLVPNPFHKILKNPSISTAWQKCPKRGNGGIGAKCWDILGGTRTCFHLRATGKCMRGLSSTVVKSRVKSFEKS